MSDAPNAPRAEILAAIRSAIGQRPKDRAEDYASVPREYQVQGSVDGAHVLDLFEERLRDYDCAVHRVPAIDVPAAIASCLTAAERKVAVIAADFPPGLLPDGCLFLPDHNLSYAEIDRSGSVLTLCAAAIALTGTIILQEGAMGQGRRALSLLPDYHLCIVEAAQVELTVPEGFRVLEASKTLATTTISGPSATADIEMTRIRGVHGPRVLEVILVV